MTIFETVKSTVNTAVDTISSVAQSLVEKNRTNAKLNRLRLVMKNESELMNRAYIALGKHYFENAKNGDVSPTDEQKKLFEVIKKSKAKIAKARTCYRKIIDSQNDIFYGSSEEIETQDYDSSDIIDITVACSNENEYESSPFETADEPAETQDVREDEKTKEQSPDVNDFKEDDTESPEGELF